MTSFVGSLAKSTLETNVRSQASVGKRGYFILFFFGKCNLLNTVKK